MRNFFWIFLILALTAFYPAAPARAQEAPKLTPEVYEIMKTMPLVTAKLIFESSAQQYNSRVDEEYADRPQEDRPYITPLGLARITEEMMQGYRSGNEDQVRAAQEFASILDVDVPAEDKIAFIEQMTKEYIAEEEGKVDQ